ncbi:MAG: hypothetical protein ACOC7V_03970 [Spirochaetota bacterium]
MKKPRPRGCPPLLGIVALVLTAHPADAEDMFAVPDGPPAHTARYTEVTDGERIDLVAREWRVDGGLLLESTSSTGDRHLVRVDERLRTRAWRFERESADVEIETIARNGTIVVGGNRDGQAVSERVQIGDARWIQSIERSLRDFVLNANEGDRIRFEVVQPDTLGARTLQARMLETGSRPVAGTPTDVRHVRISLPGIAALIWRSDYWFRLPDGLFVESRVTRGPPGTPETVVTLVDDSGPAATDGGS